MHIFYFKGIYKYATHSCFTFQNKTSKNYFRNLEEGINENISSSVKCFYLISGEYEGEIFC